MSAAPKGAKVPQDHQDADGVFEYINRNGGRIVLPRMDRLKTGFVRKNRHEAESEMMWLVVEEFADAESLAAFDDLDSDEMADFAEEWQRASGVAPGESSSSSS